MKRGLSNLVAALAVVCLSAVSQAQTIIRNTLDTSDPIVLSSRSGPDNGAWVPNFIGITDPLGGREVSYLELGVTIWHLDTPVTTIDPGALSLLNVQLFQNYTEWENSVFVLNPAIPSTGPVLPLGTAWASTSVMTPLGAPMWRVPFALPLGHGLMTTANVEMGLQAALIYNSLPGYHARITLIGSDRVPGLMSDAFAIGLYPSGGVVNPPQRYDESPDDPIYRYSAVIGVVPAPGVAVVMGLGALVATRRKRLS